MNTLKSLSIAILLFSFSSAIGQNAKKWNLDKSHSSVQFEIDHLFSAVPGKFKDFSGDISLDTDDPSNSTASFTIQVASIDTDDEDRDGHLQSGDFFAADKYKTIKFVSTSITKKGKDMLMAKGKLTMRGVTKEVSLPIQITGVVDSPWKENTQIMGLRIKTSINRTDYEVGTGSWAATAIVGDEVTIDISMELDAPK